MKKPINFVLLVTAFTLALAACSPASPLPTPTALPTGTPPAPDVEVLFYDISGFLVSIGEKKILIDTLFDDFSGHNLPAEAFELLIHGEAPFDQVDLVLTTHTHPDHFSAQVMSTFLRNNPETTLVSTAQVVEELLQETPELVNPIYAVELQPGESESISLDGIAVDCLNISHGIPDFLNLGFVVTVDGVSFFHSGDLAAGEVTIDDLLAYRLPERNLDFALVVFHLLRYDIYQPYLTEAIQAKYVIPTHYEYDQSPRPFDNFPEAVIFTDTMQTWQMP